MGQGENLTEKLLFLFTGSSFYCLFSILILSSRQRPISTSWLRRFFGGREDDRGGGTRRGRHGDGDGDDDGDDEATGALRFPNSPSKQHAASMKEEERKKGVPMR